jgi:GNAT superfamily N-acetyltransferase
MLDPIKQYSSLPSVKLTRLGVQKEYQGTDIGTQSLNMLKKFFTTDNRTGCRLVTVDAYNNPKVLAFYGKNNFQVFPMLRPDFTNV